MSSAAHNVSVSSTPGSHPLVVTDLWKSFTKGSPVLRGVTLSVEEGSSVALIGSNGSGKSTLLRCCMRLIEPDQGSVTILGKPITGIPERSLRSTRAPVGFVFQKHNLVPRLSVLSNVIHGLQSRRGGPRAWFQGLARQEDRVEALDCLRRVGLAEFAHKNASQLSGGQSQRVAIARALMQRPKVILADEPVASLDPKVGEEVMELFVSLVRERGITLVFTSHHLDHALRFATRIVGLKKGSLVLDGPSTSFSDTRLREIYDN